MTYHSPFDVLLANADATNTPWDSFYDILEYNGTLGCVLSNIATLSSSPESTADAKIWALHPPRIIRAAVDHKIQHPDLPKVEMILREAIDVSLGIYSNPTNSAKAVSKLRDKIRSVGLEDMLTSQLNQPSDYATWCAMLPIESKSSAERLASAIQNDAVLFIALAHGSIAAGMDVYLRYCDDSRSKDSAFYVARLSTQKLNDTLPRLSTGEIDYLRKLAKYRAVVVFDEDSATGRTIKIARDYFSTIFPGQRVMILTNFSSEFNTEICNPTFANKLQPN